MAFNKATITGKTMGSDGSFRLDVNYEGDAGESPVIQPINMIANDLPTMDEFRAAAMNRLAIFNIAETVLASLNLPLILDTTTPIPPGTPNAIQQSYMAVGGPFTPGATPQDVFTITGSATKKVTILRIALSAVQTSAGNNAWHVVRRSTVNTGGTSALVPAVPTDDSFAAATAIVRQYTANPTAGSLVGRMWTGRTSTPAPGTANIGDIEKIVLFDYAPVVLTGVNDMLAWNFNGVALPSGLSVTPYVWWHEI